MVEGGGFEPPKAEPADLQSDPFGRSGTPPISGNLLIIFRKTKSVNLFLIQTQQQALLILFKHLINLK